MVRKGGAKVLILNFYSAAFHINNTIDIIHNLNKVVTENRKI